MKKIIISLIFLVCCGCVTTHIQEPIDYGRPLTKDFKPFIRSYFEEFLIDPSSVTYDFQEPKKAYIKKTFVWSYPTITGYLIVVGVNAKNAFGGYTGKKYYGFMFKNDIFIRIITSEEMEYRGFNL